MNHTDSLGAKQLFTPLRFRCQQVFFISRKFFSRPRRGNSLARGRLMSHFQTRVKNFLPSGKISFPVALSYVASSLARTALCAFSIPPSSIFPQKNLRFCFMLTDYSINIPERQAKFPEYFFAAFSFAPLLSSPIDALSSPLWTKMRHFLQQHRLPQIVKTFSPPCIFFRPLFDNGPQQKREPEGSPLIRIHGNA